MDELRVWASRLVAPLAFIAAAVVLVVVVERALDDDSGLSASAEPTPIVSVSVPVETVETEVAPAEEQFYRIRAGDTLEAISLRFGTTVESLLALNPGIDPLALSPGQRIRVA